MLAGSTLKARHELTPRKSGAFLLEYNSLVYFVSPNLYEPGGILGGTLIAYTTPLPQEASIQN